MPDDGHTLLVPKGGRGAAQGSKAKVVFWALVVTALLLLAGVGVGVGIGVKRHNDKKHKPAGTTAAPGSSPTPGNGTVQTKSYRTVPYAQNAEDQIQILQSIGTDTSKMTAKAYQDAQVLTVELVSEFVKIFLELASDGAVDNSTMKVLQDNRYLLVRYLRAHRKASVVKAVQKLAEGPDNLPPVVVRRIVLQTAAMFADGDFQRWLASGARDVVRTLTAAQVTILNALEGELGGTHNGTHNETNPQEPYSEDSAQQLAFYQARLAQAGIVLGRDPFEPGMTSRRRRLAAAAQHRMFDEFAYGAGGRWPLRVAEANRELGSRQRQAAGGRRMMEGAGGAGGFQANLGLDSFSRARIGIIFHAFQFADTEGYLYPIAANQDGPAHAQRLVDLVNGFYWLSGVNLEFYVKEYRYNVTQYPYLLASNVDAWQQCASDAASCTCQLAEQHNFEPTKYVNVYITGSYLYPGLTSAAVGYTSTLPYIMDQCAADPNTWNQADVAKTQHLWLLFDSFDTINSTLLDTKYNEGAATLAHELGHFLGLLHTHGEDEGCKYSDLVADTPVNLVVQDQDWAFPELYNWCAAFLAGKKPNTAALKKFDSCRGDKFIDSVFNIMSYTPAPCNLYFTVGQVRRLQATTAKLYQDMLMPV